MVLLKIQKQPAQTVQTAFSQNIYYLDATAPLKIIYYLTVTVTACLIDSVDVH